MPAVLLGTMRRQLHRHRWVTLAVTGLLMLATSGMALSRMTCLKAGHSVLALGQMEDCCPEGMPVDGPAFHDVCCVFGQAGGDVLPFVPTETMAVSPLWFAHAVPPMVTTMIGNGEALPTVFIRPPPGTGTERLAFLRTFRV